MPASFENTSTIDSYVCIGYTPIYMDELGSGLAKDVFGMSASCRIEVEGLQAGAGAEVANINGCMKSMFAVTDMSGNYPVVPAGRSISCVIEVSRSDLEGLHIILVPEAIQATRKVAGAAAVLGWDGSLAVNQAFLLYWQRERAANHAVANLNELMYIK
ncbi:MAG: hypothetical protein LBU32_23640 [Clostridiales bacterium]|jgi:hypothetical protein|nr:hypothetical protein [Clostridiales bacterium]